MRIPDSHIETIVTALLDIGDRFQGREGPSEIPTSSGISFRIEELLGRLPTQEARFSVIKRAMEHTNHSLYTIIALVFDLRLEHGKIENREKLKPVEAQILSESQLEELERLVCSKIEASAARDLLLHPMSSIILYRWDTWCPSTKAQDFVNGLLRTDEGLLDFIAGCTLPPGTFFIAKDTPHVRWEIDLKTVTQFVSLEDVEPRIRKIAAEMPPESVDKREADALFTLLKSYDDEEYRKELRQFEA
ncbi:MAG: hypothetical protein ACLPI9_07930 [Halobacteriota archaeon]